MTPPTLKSALPADPLPDAKPQPGVQMAETLSALRELTAEAKALQRVARGSLTTRALEWLIPQYAVAARQQLQAATTAPQRWQMLSHMAIVLAAVRRAEIDADRVQLERERLVLDRARAKAAREKEFWQWTKRPAIREKLWPPHNNVLTQETLEKIERELGLC